MTIGSFYGAAQPQLARTSIIRTIRLSYRATYIFTRPLAQRRFSFFLFILYLSVLRFIRNLHYSTCRKRPEGLVCLYTYIYIYIRTHINIYVDVYIYIYLYRYRYYFFSLKRTRFPFPFLRGGYFSRDILL